MTRNYPTSKDVWPAASFYSGKTFSTAGSTTWPEDVGDQFEAIEDYLGVIGDTNLSTITAKVDWVRTAYTPTWQGSNISSHPATWTGNYVKNNHLGLISIKGAISGTWTATSGGYTELSLPATWTSQSSFAGGVITGWANLSGLPFGLHYPIIGKVAPGSTGVRLLCPGTTTVSGSGVTGSPVTVAANAWVYVDGVNAPFAFASGTELYLSGFVILA